MKAITLHQPWATLVAIGAKQFETRSWDTNFRGRLAIHAAKTKRSRNTFWAYRFSKALVDAGYSNFDDLPFGAVLCVVELVKTIRLDIAFSPKLTLTEVAFGNYTPGRYAWELKLLEVFDPPIPARGYQRFWNWKKE